MQSPIGPGFVLSNEILCILTTFSNFAASLAARMYNISFENTDPGLIDVRSIKILSIVLKREMEM